MKKYLLSALLGVFGLVGAFASADTLDGFTSSSDICTFNYGYSQSTLGLQSLTDNCSDINNQSFYVCINTNNIPYYAYSSDYSLSLGSSIDSPVSVSSSNYCFEGTFDDSNDGDIYFCNSVGEYDTCDSDENFTFTAYASNSPITYSSSAGGDSSGSLLPGGESYLSSIITGLNSTITEFIPYLVYLGLGIITVIIGFVAIRWLVNRTQAKIRGTFSSGRRRR